MKLFFVIPSFVFLLTSCGNKTPEQTSDPIEQNKSLVKDDEMRLTIFNADSARTDFKKRIHRIIQYGLPIARDYTDSLNEKYNFFYFYDMDAGCEVSQEYMNGVKIYNDEMFRLLDDVNGAGWKQKYDRDVALLEKRRLTGTK